MKCPMCNGAGYKKISAISCAICERCGGIGEVKQTNFDRITASPKVLAELIADAMFLYSTNRHIFTIEAIKMASKKEKIDINLDCNYKEVVKWLNEESKE